MSNIYIANGKIVTPPKALVGYKIYHYNNGYIYATELSKEVHGFSNEITIFHYTKHNVHAVALLTIPSQASLYDLSDAEHPTNHVFEPIIETLGNVTYLRLENMTYRQSAEVYKLFKGHMYYIINRDFTLTYAGCYDRLYYVNGVLVKYEHNDTHLITDNKLNLSVPISMPFGANNEAIMYDYNGTYMMFDGTKATVIGDMRGDVGNHISIKGIAYDIDYDKHHYCRELIKHEQYIYFVDPWIDASTTCNIYRYNIISKEKEYIFRGCSDYKVIDDETFIVYSNDQVYIVTPNGITTCDDHKLCTGVDRKYYRIPSITERVRLYSSSLFDMTIVCE